MTSASGPSVRRQRADALRALTTRECWNHNTHYHRHLPRWVAPPWGHVLDVGCGEGLLTRRLAPFATSVTGVDADEAMVARARELGPGIAYVHGDALTADLGGPFDLVTCFATLHHLGLVAGLERLRGLVAPGGAVVVVGLARPTTPREYAWSALGALANTPARWARGDWRPGAPVRDPAESYADVRAAAERSLPGARLRYHLYWRYSLVWRAPLSP